MRVDFYEDIAYFLRAIIVKSQSLIVYYLICTLHVVIGITDIDSRIAQFICFGLPRYVCFVDSGRSRQMCSLKGMLK